MDCVIVRVYAGVVLYQDLQIDREPHNQFGKYKVSVCGLLECSNFTLEPPQSLTPSLGFGTIFP